MQEEEHVESWNLQMVDAHHARVLALVEGCMLDHMVANLQIDVDLTGQFVVVVEERRSEMAMAWELVPSEAFFPGDC